MIDEATPTQSLHFLEGLRPFFGKHISFRNTRNRTPKPPFRGTADPEAYDRHFFVIRFPSHHRPHRIPGCAAVLTRESRDPGPVLSACISGDGPMRASPALILAALRSAAA